MSQPQPEADIDAEGWARLLQEALQERDREWSAKARGSDGNGG